MVVFVHQDQQGIAAAVFQQASYAKVGWVEQIIDDGHLDRVIVVHEEHFQCAWLGGEGEVDQQQECRRGGCQQQAGAGDEGEGRLGGYGLAGSIILSLVAPEVESLHVGLGVFAGVVADVPRGSFPDAGGAIPRAGDDAFAVSAEHG